MISLLSFAPVRDLVINTETINVKLPRVKYWWNINVTSGKLKDMKPEHKKQIKSQPVKSFVFMVIKQNKKNRNQCYHLVSRHSRDISKLLSNTRGIRKEIRRVCNPALPLVMLSPWYRPPSPHAVSAVWGNECQQTAPTVAASHLKSSTGQTHVPFYWWRNHRKHHVSFAQLMWSFIKKGVYKIRSLGFICVQLGIL